MTKKYCGELVKLYFYDQDELETAARLLDDGGYDYHIDGRGRIVTDAETEEVLSSEGFRYEID